MPDLGGRTFVVTGANSGIGFETALALAKKGGAVVLACRNAEKGEGALARIRATAPDAKLELEELDLGDLTSIRAFAQRFTAKHARLDVLVNNAGIMAIPRRTTRDGFEMQIGTNHLGHFALTGLLLEPLVRGSHSRVVTVSSLVHVIGRFGALDEADLLLSHGYGKWQAYARSKLANLLFTYELERKLAARFPEVISVACHPGYASTNLQAVGPTMSGSISAKTIMSLGNALFSQNAAAGAWPSLYAAVASDVKGGDFIGPGGPFHIAGAPTKQRSNRRSHGVDEARRLWEASVKLTQVDYGLLA